MNNHVYGIWLGNGWLKDGDGMPIYSGYVQMMSADVREFRGDWPRAEVKEIGDEGEPGDPPLKSASKRTQTRISIPAAKPQNS
jgi:hypothetical protein